MGHFLQLLRYHHVQTWWQICKGRVLWYQCDYFLGYDRRMFEAIVIQDPRNFAPKPFPPLGIVATTTYPVSQGVPTRMPRLTISATIDRTLEPHGYTVLSLGGA